MTLRIFYFSGIGQTAFLFMLATIAMASNFSISSTWVPGLGKVGAHPAFCTFYMYNIEGMFKLVSRVGKRPRARERWH